ncbi:WD40 repeat domain-containing protein [Streptacidiphilus sp. PAMC 29251]
MIDRRALIAGLASTAAVVLAGCAAPTAEQGSSGQQKGGTGGSTAPLVLHDDSGEITSVAVSPDGRRLATGSGYGNGDDGIRLWDLEGRRLLRQHQTDGVPVSSVAFSADGAIAAASSELLVLDGATLAPRYSLPMSAPGADGCVAFSHDGKLLVAGGQGGTLHLWDLASRKERRSPLRAPAGVSAVLFADGGRLVAAACGGSGVCLWDTVTGASRVLPAAPAAVLGLGPDGTTLVTGGATGSLQGAVVEVWDVVGNARLTSPTVAGGLAAAVAVSPDGHTLAVGSDTGVQTYQLSGGRPLRSWSTADKVAGLVFTGGGRSLAAGLSNGTVALLDPAPA